MERFKIVNPTTACLIEAIKPFTKTLTSCTGGDDRERNPQGREPEKLYTESTMIKVASFKISDSEGINALLEKYPLASGAHILVSEGQLCVPYEDGLEPNTDQRVIEILEQKNVMLVQYRMLIHSQRVLEEQMKDMEGKIEELRERVTFPKTKEGYDQRKEVDEEIKRLEKIVEDTNKQYTQNKAEVYRMEVNFQVFDEKVQELRG